MLQETVKCLPSPLTKFLPHEDSFTQYQIAQIERGLMMTARTCKTSITDEIKMNNE